MDKTNRKGIAQLKSCLFSKKQGWLWRILAFLFSEQNESAKKLFLTPTFHALKNLEMGTLQKTRIKLLLTSAKNGL